MRGETLASFDAQKPGADEHAVGTEHQRGGEPATLGDATRRAKQRARDAAAIQIGNSGTSFSVAQRSP